MNKIVDTFEGLTNLQKILALIIVSVVIYVASTSVSYSVFSKIVKPQGIKEAMVTSLPGASSVVTEDPNEPKTESCPLNGSMRTKRAREAWEKRRPLAVMIENHSEARPQSGLSSADIIYEVVAEGGITRFMALFYCNLGDVQVGPVRSARTYYLDWLGEYDALYAHVGGANTPGPADALGQIITYKVKDLNQFSIGFPIFWRDYQRLGHPVATEHTMYSTTQKLWEVGAKRGWEATDSAGIKWDAKFTPWKFKDPAPSGAGQATKIKVNFWESQGEYAVEWNYDAISNSYKRKNGQDHVDLNNKQQLTAKNIVVQFQREANANDGYPGNVHLLYGTAGSGKALFFQDGGVIEGKWIKQSRLSRSKYVDSKGVEIQFNKGQIWIQTVPEGSKVTY
ncbi:MAG: Uncharacterized protein G01um10147_937 [Microgenomates group bacterium Gr01-1014_7]|nr:MAG: Uncharacterized protein G01um10147_937 [Microgenomates group bacterium Gr01-1014_7]